MLKLNYINQKLLSHFSKIIKEDLKDLNVDAAFLKLQHAEQKEPDLLQITKEDHTEVK